MPFEIVRNDISKLKVDAVVIVAGRVKGDDNYVTDVVLSTVDGLNSKKVRDKIASCDAGEVVITRGYDLPAKYVLYSVCREWAGGLNGELDLLYKCYLNALETARKKRCKSVAIPMMSSDAIGYPKDETLRIAISAIGEFLLRSEMHISLVVFDRASFSLRAGLHASIAEFIKECSETPKGAPTARYAQVPDYDAKVAFLSEEFAVYTQTSGLEAASERIQDFHIAEKSRDARFLRSREYTGTPAPSVPPNERLRRAPKKSLDSVMTQLEETFSKRLLRMIDERGLSDVEVYKRANIDRRVFSQIRTKKHYQPSKNTAIALAIALRLSLDDASDLLKSAGYALSRSSKQDIIIEYFINERNYNIIEINEALFAFDQNLLGA